jgi:hypothetical protein
VVPPLAGWSRLHYRLGRPIWIVLRLVNHLTGFMPKFLYIRSIDLSDGHCDRSTLTTAVTPAQAQTNDTIDGRGAFFEETAGADIDTCFGSPAGEPWEQRRA